MVEEFMICVDRLIASSSASSAAAACFDSPVNEVSNSERVQDINGAMEGLKTQESEKSNGEFGNEKDGFLRECRICQEEDEEQDMESPCACTGTLKFAHRKCIQRWCNKKGDIRCEICNQMFSPDYISPPKHADVVAIDIREAWGSNFNLQDPHFLAFAAAEQQFLQSEYEYYATTNSSTLACFRSVVIVVMLLLLIRHTLLVTRDFGMVQGSSTFYRYQILLLQLAGFLLPCYVMACSWYIAQCRRRRQVC
ncbi:unnamed protein product [Coffea canephora]|uniref:RING-CH-type domain-containing protein n=1 Tax=Coffea canephora TaxID=49390 RepID=A0A068UQP2_COFCA|nr:unnamed protein product [Coffea canephora]